MSCLNFFPCELAVQDFFFLWFFSLFLYVTRSCSNFFPLFSLAGIIFQCFAPHPQHFSNGPSLSIQDKNSVTTQQFKKAFAKFPALLLPQYGCLQRPLFFTPQIIRRLPDGTRWTLSIISDSDQSDCLNYQRHRV